MPIGVHEASNFLLNGGKPKQSYGSVTANVDILRSRLKADGELSPGDHQNLVREYRKIYSNPGLTRENRIEISKKIAEEESLATTTALSFNNDTSRINTDYSNSVKQVSLAAGKDPRSFLMGKLRSLDIKIFNLKDSIANLNRSGDNGNFVDDTKQQEELYKTIDEWQDTKKALTIAENYKSGSPPQFDFVAYIETNSDGKIRNIDIGPPGMKIGYLDTNGILGGFPILGRINSKGAGIEGKGIFKLGQTTFQETSVPPRLGMDGTMKASTLMADPQRVSVGSRGRTKAIGEYQDISPQSIQVQDTANPGDWIKGKGDTFYKSLDNGNYEKYVGATKDNLAITDNEILSSLPDNMISEINKRSTRTIDLTPPFVPPSQGSTFLPPKPFPNMTMAPTPVAGYNTSTPPSATSRTNSPVVRAPQDAQGIASSTQKKAGILSRILGI